MIFLDGPIMGAPTCEWREWLDHLKQLDQADDSVQFARRIAQMSMEASQLFDANEADAVDNPHL